MTIQYVYRVGLLGLKIIPCNLPLMSFHLIFKAAIQKACSHKNCQNEIFKTHTRRLFEIFTLPFIIPQFTKANHNPLNRKQELNETIFPESTEKLRALLSSQLCVHVHIRVSNKIWILLNQKC